VNDEQYAGISKIALAWGAARLFLFLIGVKRSFRRDDGIEIRSDGQLLYGVGAGPASSRPITKGS
jgi:hypothetical protein